MLIVALSSSNFRMFLSTKKDCGRGLIIYSCISCFVTCTNLKNPLVPIAPIALVRVEFPSVYDYD